MSRGSLENRPDLIKKLTRELRQFNGLGVSFFRAGAARIEMTETDLQVIDFLDSAGPMTAGQIADLTGLTTGAITGMITRLEETGRVRRERDPNDGRRVIVRLEKSMEEMQDLNPIFDSIENAWGEMASHYSDEQLAFLVEFLKQSNTISRREIFRLRGTPPDEGGTFSAPLGKLESAQLIVSSGVSNLTLRADEELGQLYKASFKGSLPDVKVKEGVVTLRYPRRLWVVGGEKREAEVRLNTNIPWKIVLQAGPAQVEAMLGSLKLAGLEVKGGLNTIRLQLPVPSGLVPIRFKGDASDVVIRRPAGIPAQVHFKGWVSEFVFDDRTFSELGNDMRLQSPDFKLNSPGYDIEVSSSASTVTITSV